MRVRVRIRVRARVRRMCAGARVLVYGGAMVGCDLVVAGRGCEGVGLRCGGVFVV